MTIIIIIILVAIIMKHCFRWKYIYYAIVISYFKTYSKDIFLCLKQTIKYIK